MKLKITVNGQAYDVEVQVLDDSLDPPPTIDTPKEIAAPKKQAKIEAPPYQAPTSSPSPQTTPSSAKNAISAPIPGLITKLLCEVGKSYAQNDTLVIIEAMKMETELKAPKNLTVKKILVNAGDNVTQGASIIEFDESSS